MTAVEQIIHGLLSEKGTGIYLKHLRSGPLYTCKCPNCGTLHGGFRSYTEAQANLKCRRCNRTEVDKLKKDVEKVEEPPKPQKNIFQNPLKKPTVIGESEESDFEVKDVGLPTPEHVAYEIDDGTERFPVTNEGKIGRQGWTDLSQFSGQWRLMGIMHQFNAAGQWRRFTPWPEIVKLLDSGETISGHMYDFDHGGYRQWGRKAKVYKISVNESLDDDEEELEDVKSILGDIPLDPDAPTEPGQVNKWVCVNAHYRQEFFSRYKFYGNGFPKRVRVSGKCKTWKTRPNEFRLPVKYGFSENLYITHDNQGDWSTVPFDASGRPV